MSLPLVFSATPLNGHKIVVNSMHERKVEMAKRAGAFVGLPGGFGSFEEVPQHPSLNGTAIILMPPTN